MFSLHVGTAALLCVAFASAPSTALAQMAPNGSYMKSCSGGEVVDDVLLANCKQRDGTTRAATLANPYGCHSDITNNNGRLVCAGASPSPSPSPTPTPQPAPAPIRQRYSAKFSDTCFGQSYYVVRTGGSGEIIRFYLDQGQKVHFWLPSGSTYAKQCNSYPSIGSATNAVEFE
jgi:hypothetical protein